MKIKIFYILLSGLFLNSCQKNIPKPIKVNTEECIELDFDLGGGLWITTLGKDRFQYKKPQFNPNNNDEFIYVYNDLELFEKQLIKYNLKTLTKTVLVDNARLVTQPKWSRKGWVAFDNVITYKTSILKDNGDSLTDFATNAASIYTAWDATGSNLYYQHTPALGVPYYLFKQNLETKIIDTILFPYDEHSGYAVFNDISIDNKIISVVGINNQKHIGVTNLDDFSFKSLINLEADSLRAEGLCWSNTSDFAYLSAYLDGLYRIDISTGEYELLLEYCSSKQYKNISCSPDGTKIIAERIDSYVDKDVNGNITGKIVQNSSIYIFDLLTLTETKINL